MADVTRWAARPGAGGRTGHDVEDCLRALHAAGIDHVVWGPGGGPTALRHAVAFAARQSMVLCARLCMNPRGASGASSGRAPWRCVARDGTPDPDRSSFFFPGVREERLEALLDMARAGVTGLWLDFCDRPPHLRYHPDMVREYVITGGAEPGSLKLTDGEFRDWCGFRAGFLTTLLRELRTALAEIEREQARSVSIVARVPDDGPELNLAAGMDVRTWCRHGLVDLLCVDPLRWLAMDYPETIEPYVSLGQETQVGVVGGISMAAPPGVEKNPIAMMRRAHAQYEQAADGMAVDAAETGVMDGELRWTIPALAEPERLARLVSDEERQRQYPLTEANLWFGVDALSCVPGAGRTAFPPTEL